ncbi:hypothetical protein ABZP36_000082 [Zizania latifolia]
MENDELKMKSNIEEVDLMIKEVCGKIELIPDGVYVGLSINHRVLPFNQVIYKSIDPVPDEDDEVYAAMNHKLSKKVKLRSRGQDATSQMALWNFNLDALARKKVAQQNFLVARNEAHAIQYRRYQVIFTDHGADEDDEVYAALNHKLSKKSIDPVVDEDDEVYAALNRKLWKKVKLCSRGQDAASRMALWNFNPDALVRKKVAHQNFLDALTEAHAIQYTKYRIQRPWNFNPDTLKLFCVNTNYRIAHKRFKIISC